MTDCKHEWQVEWFGPTGSGYTEEKCRSCGCERVTCIVTEIALQLAMLKADRALIQAANSTQK